MTRAGGLLLLCLAFTFPAGAGAQVRLHARPSALAVGSLPGGLSRISAHAYAYRPDLPAGARPGLLVLFHGAGGDARRFIEPFRQQADRRQLLLLSIQSTERTWDVVLKGSRNNWYVGRAGTVEKVGIDARHANAALTALFKQVAVDPERIVAAGFSDGASYALSLGLENDHLFKGIIALAPGFAAESPVRTAQRIAIAHGRSDRVLSHGRAQAIAADLANRGHPTEFISFAGDHSIDPDSLERALDFVLGRAGGGAPL